MEGVCDGSLIAARNALLMIGAVCSAIRAIRAERDRLCAELRDAASSLECIANCAGIKGYDYLADIGQVRGYAESRAAAARAALAPAEEVKP